MKEGVNIAEYLYKYYPIVDYALNSLDREEVCFNSMRAFNDKQEGLFHMEARESGFYNLDERLAERIGAEYSERIIFQYRVLSLTTKCNMKYMWENYAQNGSGFCIEYRCQDLISISTDADKIKYSSKKEPNAYFEDPIQMLDWDRELCKILFTKEEKWKNECEVRLTYKISSDLIEPVDMEEFLENKWQSDSEYEYWSKFITKEHFKCPKRIMKRCIPNKIYLGPYMSEENENRIKQIISGRAYTFERIMADELQ